MGFERCDIYALAFGEKAAHLGQPAVAIGRQVQLGPVASGENGRLVQPVVADEPGQSRGLVAFGEGQPLADFHRRGVVINS